MHTLSELIKIGHSSGIDASMGVPISNCVR